MGLGPYRLHRDYKVRLELTTGRAPSTHRGAPILQEHPQAAALAKALEPITLMPTGAASAARQATEREAIERMAGALGVGEGEIQGALDSVLHPAKAASARDLIALCAQAKEGKR